MTQSFKFQVNKKGVRELLQSPEMMSVCKKYADGAISSLGEGYKVTTQKGKNRVNAEVAAVSKAAKKDNLDNNTILKAIRGSHG